MSFPHEILAVPHDIIAELVNNPTVRQVALGAGALGVVSGTLGSFAVLRKQSLLGDAISHAALPGVALAFLLTRSKSPLILIAGAALAGWIGTLIVLRIVGSSRIKFDSALGGVLSVFFGAGIVLLTYIQKNVHDASQAGLDRFLYGQAATMLEEDVYAIVILGAVALVVLLVFWKEFKLLSFDPEYMASQGWPVRGLDVLLTTLLVAAIVLGLQCVGAVLMSALVVAPAAAARQWTDRLGRMVLLAAAFGGGAGVTGTVLSDRLSQPGATIPTGPTIVLAASALVLISILAAPHRGILWQLFRFKSLASPMKPSDSGMA